MKESVKNLEALMEIGGIKKDVCFLVISGIALLISIFKWIPLPFDAAASIAGQLHIKEVQANCLPEDKLNFIRSCQEKKELVCMIGDGVNDAPALKAADVGIAMGGVGSDIAVDAADIALVDDEVKEIPHLVALSKRMMTTIKVNMTFSMALNFLAITLAITGKLNPVVGALVHNAGSVLVITNSALLLKWKLK